MSNTLFSGPLVSLYSVVWYVGWLISVVQVKWSATKVRVFILKEPTCSFLHSFSLHSDWSICMLHRGSALMLNLCKNCMLGRCLCFVFNCSATLVLSVLVKNASSEGIVKIYLFTVQVLGTNWVSKLAFFVHLCEKCFKPPPHLCVTYNRIDTTKITQHHSKWSRPQECNGAFDSPPFITSCICQYGNTATGTKINATPLYKYQLCNGIIEGAVGIMSHWCKYHDASIGTEKSYDISKQLSGSQENNSVVSGTVGIIWCLHWHQKVM